MKAKTSEKYSEIRVVFNSVWSLATATVRRRELAEVCATLPRGRGLFLVTNTATLHATADVFDVPWLCASDGADKPSALWTTARGENPAA